jgi:CPA2 family monovalent cation:H+ antiporter-2
MTDTTLSLDLAAATLIALAGGALARLLRLPVFLGYLAAGLALSPFTPGPVGDVAAVQRLADLGVVMLMFGMGVQFSLRDLAAGRDVAAGAAVQVPLSLATTALAMWALGWSWPAALYAGAAACSTSSIVLVKLLTERNAQDSPHGRLAIAWSLAQDLLTVIVIAVLGAVARAGGLDARVGTATLEAAAFVGAALFVGTRVVPPLLVRIARLGSRELFILSVAGLAVGTAVLGERFGLSLALGAFIAGIAVSESDVSHHALGELLPIRDLFAGLFFVWVGMLIDPRLLMEQPALFAALALLMLSKAAIGAVLVAGPLRRSARTAALAGVALAPSAEFSFVVARDGVTAGALSAEQFSLILAATAATIPLSPSLMRLAPAVQRLLEPLALRAGAVAVSEPSPAPPRLRNHVVIVGGGRVGSLIAAVLRRRGQGYVIIEEDRRTAERLRAAGEPVIYGNAAHPAVLAQANPAHARTLVVAIPDPVAARRVVSEARAQNPRLDIVVRAHSPADAADFLRLGAAEAVLAERELALELTRHTLHRIGLTTLEIQAILQRLRFGEEPPTR